MNDATGKQLIHELKAIKAWVTVLAVISLALLAVMGYFVWRVTVFTNQTQQQIDSIHTSISEQTDIKHQVCESDNVVSEFIKDRTNVCE